MIHLPRPQSLTNPPPLTRTVRAGQPRGLSPPVPEESWPSRNPELTILLAALAGALLGWAIKTRH